MGDPASFTNWPLIAFAFQRDTAFMKGHNLIDESLLIQIAGPFDVEINETSYLVAGGFLSGEALKRTFAKLPLCAYQLELTQKRMGIVCVSILDYLLTFSFTKSIQNYIQGDRWTHYEEKLLELLQCVGNLNQPNCDEFRKFADEGWLEAVQRQLAKKSTADYVGRLEEESRCCCDTGGHPLKPQTKCEWQAHKTLSFGRRCKDGLYHWPARDGGCWALIAARLGLKD
uniref:Uncharacterized protein n=1 Tax=Pyrodinium bahamense TaxID=73915 RepID=A0A7S0A7G1_9DINO